MGAKADREERKRMPRRPGPDEIAGKERPTPAEPSEDFAERKDIETADKPREEHDRRHHERDVESVPPA
jgi:hypothetical protein